MNKTDSDNVNIKNLEELDNILSFTIENINVSYVNAIRRILHANIPIIVFKTNPYSENKVNIEINKTRLNNELIKQRLSCIPIHIDDIENFSYEDYEVYLEKKNETNEIIYATTEDFKIKNIKLNKFLNSGDVKKIFPPDSITEDYIDIVRLRPKINENNNFDEIKLSCKLSVSTAEDDGTFNVISIASYGNTLNPVEIKNKWDLKEDELKLKYSNDEIQKIKLDWMLIDAKRIFIDNSFDFKLKTIGIYSNIKLMTLASKILIKKLFILVDDLKNDYDLIEEIPDNLDNCFKITILNEDYTIGKIIENYLYKKYFIKEKIISFVSFLKKHPHDNNSIIKISYNYLIKKDEIITHIEEASNYAIAKINEIKNYFEE
tara:strand:+ start:2462 stop:3589 length:1128 start_codon:yes stop_codon:yes gene_type:complete